MNTPLDSGYHTAAAPTKLRIVLIEGRGGRRLETTVQAAGILW